jgi:hypothetical protein
MRTLPLLALFACKGPSAHNSTVDTADTGTADVCLAQWSDGLTEPDETGPDTQIHATSVFDGEHLWVAWNRRDSGTKFDIWLERIACDGTVNVGPIEVTNTNDSELDPVLAISGDRLLVAWTSDNGVGPNNLDIRTRVYDLDGNPLTDPTDVAGTRAGAPNPGNALFPALAATADGFLLAGSWGHDDAPAFQAFVAPLDLDGNAVGDAIDGQLDPDHGQTYVAIATHDGTTQALWQEDAVGSDTLSLEGGLLGSAAPIAAPAARADVSHGPDGFWQAWDDDSGIVYAKPPQGAPTRISGPSFEHSPSVVATADGSMILSMELVGSISNRIKLRRLDVNGDVTYEHSLQTEGAVSIYGVDLTVVDDQHAVVVYQDGENPAFRVKAEWITLP